jgi:cobalt-zinc-cadmium efflux system membrane fusion protein
VDKVSRTVDIIYSLKAPGQALRVGGLVQVSLPAGDDFQGIIVPRTAVVNDDGRETVYVQVDGEHFAERLIRTGPRSGDRVGVQHGLVAGDRVVTQGAHLVRLADRARSSQPHGHIH